MIDYYFPCLFQWEVDSAAMGPWHIGKGPDSRAMKTLKKNGIKNYVHKARQVRSVPWKARL